jgi:hypothetical protein
MDEAMGAGYTFGFSSYPGSQGDPMATGRWAVYSIDGTKSLERKLGLRAGRWVEHLKNLVVAKLSLGTTLVKQQNPGS